MKSGEQKRRAFNGKEAVVGETLTTARRGWLVLNVSAERIWGPHRGSRGNEFDSRRRKGSAGKEGCGERIEVRAFQLRLLEDGLRILLWEVRGILVIWGQGQGDCVCQRRP